MQLEITSLPSGILQLSLSGRLDIAGVGQIDNQFAFAATTKTMPVLVDLSAVEFVASFGIRMLLMNAKSLQGRGGKMVLYQPSALVKDALTTAGIDLLIPIYDDFDAASAYLLETPATVA